MLIAQKPDNEQSRLASLRALDVLDSAPEAQFNTLVRSAALLTGTPVALLSLIDTSRQWFKANIGLPGLTETSRDVAFCAHTILQDDVLEVPDVRCDPRFAGNPLVAGSAAIRFYAGAPICLEDGSRVGALCVLDRRPRRLGAEQLDILRHLAQAVAAALEGRRAIQQLRETSGEMHYHATHDALTGLVNRSEFEVRLRRVLQKVGEDRSEHALLYLDIDQFKLVNDSCGHAIGDQLLQEVGRLFSATIRARDTLARLGGDEFAIILEHCPVEQAQRVAQQICDAMSNFRFAHDDRSFRVGASIGLVPVDDRWTTTAAIMQAADASCYAAKEAGRNRIHLWLDTDTAIRVRAGEMQWAMRIEHALDQDQFVLHAQRIEELGTQSKGLLAQGVRAEVLLRMLQDDGDLVPPGAFLPAAERFHLASRVDRWVLQHALLAAGVAGCPGYPHAVYQSVRSVNRGPGLSSARHRVIQRGWPADLRAGLRRDHGNRRRDQHGRCGGLHQADPCAGSAGGAGRFRRRGLLVRLSEDPASGLSEDRWPICPGCGR